LLSVLTYPVAKSLFDSFFVSQTYQNRINPPTTSLARFQSHYLRFPWASRSQSEKKETNQTSPSLFFNFPRSPNDFHIVITVITIYHKKSELFLDSRVCRLEVGIELQWDNVMAAF
jgi:hypothetical protein